MSAESHRPASIILQVCHANGRIKNSFSGWWPLKVCLKTQRRDWIVWSFWVPGSFGNIEIIVFEGGSPCIQLVLQNVRDECGHWCSAGARGLSRLLSSSSLVWNWVGLCVFAGLPRGVLGCCVGFWDWSLDPPFVIYWWGVQDWSLYLSFVAPFFFFVLMKWHAALLHRSRKKTKNNNSKHEAAVQLHRGKCQKN